jgi:hypothetical protein
MSIAPQYPKLQVPEMTSPQQPQTKAGRPKKPDKKQTKTIRLYPSDIDRLTKQHGSIQKWINKVVKEISEIK